MSSREPLAAAEAGDDIGWRWMKLRRCSCSEPRFVPGAPVSNVPSAWRAGAPLL